jgi:(p)ppGpp synthase/HD superfamily hydrolase
VTARLDQLRSIALAAHDGQLDKQGRPYSDHILAVADAVSDAAKPVALFHDAIEDDRMTWAELRKVLYRDEMLAVDLLTRRRDVPYAEYVAEIRDAPGHAGELAREVKRADLEHNLGRITPELERLRPRYEAAVAALG